MSPTGHNQVSVPSIMYGTAWKKDATARLTKQAIDAGFRAIDTANQLKHYDESLVGQAVQDACKNGLSRESLFLQTKFTSIDGQDHRLPYNPKAALSAQVRESMESSLQHFGTEYMDSFVLHGPFTRGSLTPSDWEVWGAIEDLYQAGKARMIGVSNFTAQQLEQLCSSATVKPMVVQNRCYAVMGWDSHVRQICRDNSIVYQGFSLLTANARELGAPAVHAIAKRLGATVAQVVFKFSMQIGMLPLTGTTSEKHMKEDLQSQDFQLTDGDVEVIETIAG
jgi:diketogulonate reductase-like aldo/keto reductase